eukprot:3482584-Pleurochrysis_carterae.AAC.1
MKKVSSAISVPAAQHQPARCDRCAAQLPGRTRCCPPPLPHSLWLAGCNRRGFCSRILPRPSFTSMTSALGFLFAA